MTSFFSKHNIPPALTFTNWTQEFEGPFLRNKKENKRIKKVIASSFLQKPTKVRAKSKKRSYSLVSKKQGKKYKKYRPSPKQEREAKIKQETVLRKEMTQTSIEKITNTYRKLRITIPPTPLPSTPPSHLTRHKRNSSFSFNIFWNDDTTTPDNPQARTIN